MTPDPSSTPRRRALLIATSRYEDSEFAELRGTTGDVRALERVLGDSTIGQFEIAGSLLDQPKQAIEETISEFFRSARPADLLLLYLSGHGVLSENRKHWFFAAANTKRRDLDATAVWDAWLRERMANSRSNSIVLMLDCCHSGQFIKGHTAKGATEVHVEDRFSEAGTGRITMTASTELEYAFESPSALLDIGSLSPGSRFTTHLVEGLESRAADANMDGRVSVDELFRYIERKLQSETPKQTPGWGGESFGPIWIAHGRRSHITPEVWAGIRSDDESMREAMVGVLLALLAKIRAQPDGEGVEEGVEQIRAALGQLATDRSSAVVRATAERALERSATPMGETVPAPERHSRTSDDPGGERRASPRAPVSDAPPEPDAPPVTRAPLEPAARLAPRARPVPDAPRLMDARPVQAGAEAPTPPRSSRPPGTERIRGRVVTGIVVTLLVGAGVVWIIASSGDPPAERSDSQATPSPTPTANAPALSSAERSLLRTIPTSLRGGCAPFSSDRKAQAALACDRPDYTVYYTAYRRRETMNDQYRRVASRTQYHDAFTRVSTCEGVPGVEDSETAFEGTWSRNGSKRGRQACGIDGYPGFALIVWTDDRERIQGHLEYDEADMNKANRAWQRVSKIS